MSHKTNHRFLLRDDKLFRLTEGNFTGLMKAVKDLKVQPTKEEWDGLFKKFRAIDLGEFPMQIEFLTSAGAEILANGGTVEEALSAAKEEGQEEEGGTIGGEEEDEEERSSSELTSTSTQ